MLLENNFLFDRVNHEENIQLILILTLNLSVKILMNTFEEVQVGPINFFYSKRFTKFILTFASHRSNSLLKFYKKMTLDFVR